MKRFFLILIFSILAGGLTCYSFLLVAWKFHFRPPDVETEITGTIALAVGFIGGGLLSPLGYWCLKDKNLVVILPILYISAFVVTALLTHAAPYLGIVGFFAACIIYWVVALLLSKSFAPEL